MKRLAVLVVAAAFVLGLAGLGFAQTPPDAETNFTVSAYIPPASGVTIKASSVNPIDSEFTPVTGTLLNFNPMEYNSDDGYWAPDHFFAIDVAAQEGVGAPTVTVTYSEGNNPNSPSGNGLGWKSTTTFIKITGPDNDQTETGLATHGPKKLNKDVSGEEVTSTELNGGFLRLYVGVVTKDPDAVYPDPTEGELFTNADASGTYDGTLLVSAVLP